MAYLVWSPGAAANRKRRKMFTSSRAWLSHFPVQTGGEGDFISRKNIPGKLPTFLLTFMPKATVPCGIPSAVFTVH